MTRLIMMQRLPRSMSLPYCDDGSQNRKDTEDDINYEVGWNSLRGSWKVEAGIVDVAGEWRHCG